MNITVVEANTQELLDACFAIRMAILLRSKVYLHPMNSMNSMR